MNRLTTRQRIALAILERLPEESQCALGYHVHRQPDGQWRVTMIWVVPPALGSLSVMGRESGTGPTVAAAEQALLCRVYALPLQRHCA